MRPIQHFALAGAQMVSAAIFAVSGPVAQRGVAADVMTWTR